MYSDVDLSTLDRVSFKSILRVFDLNQELVIWIKDSESKYLFANQAFLKRYMFSLSELVGKKDEDFCPKYLADSYCIDDQQVLGGEDVKNRIELIAFKHEPLAWYTTDKFILEEENGDVIGTIGISRKIDNLSRSEQLDSDILEVMDYIKNNYKSTLSIPHMAKLCSLSISAFERKFKKAFQRSPTDYILRFRINCVCNDLINTKDSVSNIALSNGFSDHSYMSRQFKKITGLSPKEFRLSS